MTTKKVLFLLSVPIIFWFITFFFFSPVSHRFQIQAVMATEIDLHFISYRYQNAERIKDGLISEIRRLEKIFSSYDPESELNYVNHNAFDRNILISKELYEVIEKGIRYGSLSNGLFDISILPLIHLWRVTDKSYHKTPDQEAIRETLERVNYGNIRLHQGQIRFMKDEMALGLGGIAKGYIIDKGIEYLKQNGIDNALLNIGGDIYALGKTIHNKKWKIDINNPRKKRFPTPFVGGLSITNRALATSGDYERFRMTDKGFRAHHILNPKTGYPTDRSISVSILATTAMDADAIATTVFILGPHKGLEFINKLDDVEGFIIYEEGKEIKWLMSIDFPFERLVSNRRLNSSKKD
ncbi:MAG TPA: FAD:protein FMN transferase [Spirochaetes bacterium]|mgnify:CR=1 FL=1|nr:FAD:protein FMN transferase [Spirochaetota bacterium]